MKIFLKGLNTCIQRKQNLLQYQNFIKRSGHEITKDPLACDIILLWTCAFRKDVQDNSISEINRCLREYQANLVVAGCLPDISPETLSAHFKGTIVNWRNDKELIEKLFGSGEIELDRDAVIFIEEKKCDNAIAYRKKNPGLDVTFHDQFIKLVVSQGCLFNCSYCSERLMFPPYHSFPEGKLVAASRRMIDKTGCTEIMLIADSVGQYGYDIGSSLPNLISRLVSITPGVRVALNNLNPSSFITYMDSMVDFIKKGQISHLNLPIQSASSKIISMMNRDYTRDDLDTVFKLLDRIGFHDFDTHIIIGFNGETEEDFQETIRFLLKYRPRYALASSYMEVPQMPSAKIPGRVTNDTIMGRMRRFKKIMQQHHIICNSDGSDRMKERFKKLNFPL